MIEKPMKTTTSTEIVRGMRKECRRITKGARTKLKRTASATGTKISRPKYSAAMISAATAMFVSTVPRGCANLICGDFSSIGVAYSPL